MHSAQVRRTVAMAAVAATATAGSLTVTDEAPASADEATANASLSWCPYTYACYFDWAPALNNYALVRQIAGSGYVDYTPSTLGMNRGTSGKRACGLRYIQPQIYDLKVSLAQNQIKEG